MFRSVRPGDHLPIHVQVEVTWRCNWRCVHCYQDDHSVEVLRLSDLRTLFRDLASSGTMHVIITGGEPLVHPDIFHILDAVRQVGMATTLYSNGHKIDRPCARELAPLVSTVELSLLAGEASVHDKLSRVRGSYERTRRAIVELLSLNVEVIVKTPVLRPAWDTLHKLEDEMSALGVQWLADPDISRSYAGADYALSYRLPDDDLRRFYLEFPQFHPTAGRSADPGMRAGLCLAGRQYCFIDAQGNVYPCLNFKSACDVEEATGQQAAAKMGNVLQQPFGLIWEKSRFARQIREATRRDFHGCGICKRSEACSPCMAANYEEHGDIFAPSKVACLPMQVFS
jgi:AdoMet-dependent heme synthase